MLYDSGLLVTRGVIGQDLFVGVSKLATMQDAAV